GWVGSPIDVLLGMDVLGRFEFGLDLRAGHLVIARPRTIRWRGARLPLEPLAGVPSVTAVINGKSVRAFVDTGARLSYGSSALATGVAPGRSERDFYPGIGVFDTEVRELPLEIAGQHLQLEFGTLPAALAGLLGATGVDAILGADILRTHRVAFQPGRRTLAIDQMA
ncbi:MAG: hypothetical protein ABIQ47_01045, partial [Tepidiformaceae bacterium]